MDDYKIKVVLLDEAAAFVRSLPIKVQEKIVYNYKKIELGLMSKELFQCLLECSCGELCCING